MDLLIGIIMLIFPGDKVEVTVYNATPEQCNADYLVTASGYEIDPMNALSSRTIAVSRDLIHKYPFGSKVLLKSPKYSGVYTVRDLMNKRYTNTVDILIDPYMSIGKWEGSVLPVKYTWQVWN